MDRDDTRHQRERSHTRDPVGEHERERGGGTTRGKDAAPGAALAAGQPANVDARVRITNVGPTSFNTSSNDPAISAEGVDDTGNTDTSVTFFGTFPPCPDADTPNPLQPGRASRPALRIWCPAGSRRWPTPARTPTRPHQSPGP